MLTLLFSVVVALSVALVVACRLLCTARRDREVVVRKLKGEYVRSAHLIGVIRHIQRQPR